MEFTWLDSGIAISGTTVHRPASTEQVDVRQGKARRGAAEIPRPTFLIGSRALITIEDCIGLCGLSRDQIDAIAEHEHLPEAAAAALAAWLMGKPAAGQREIRDMMRDDVRAAIASGNHAHAAELLSALRHFLTEHSNEV